VLERDDVLPLILMVDDEPANLELIKAYLSNVPCDVMTAGDGQAALEAAARRTPDLVLLDIVMPRMDGFETCARLKADARNRLVPVVMITGMDDTKARVRALEAGADDFLSKPVEQIELVARVQSMLRLKSSYDQLDDAQHVIIALARAVEAKDTYTEAHTGRVAASGRALAEAAGVGGKELEAIYLGGIIHDIGKIGMPDAILLKPSALSVEERHLMIQHPIIGEEIARPLRSAATLLSIIRHHHESWDGKGYPDGLAGEDIPLAARIVAICDAFDAMTSDRPYRPGRSSEAATQVLLEGAGQQWDPRLVHLFVDRHIGINSTPRQQPTPETG
jgi:putative two-component system response regulator